MSEVSATHASFTIGRTIHAPRERVWQAFADVTAKERWFKGPDDGTPNTHRMDFRVGGHESNTGTFHDGVEHRFEATYYDIVEQERIIYAYEMYLNGKRISVSVATIELEPNQDSTQLTISESGVFLDGLDRPEMRQQGTQQLIDALIQSLEAKETV
jgi:uncharacterized protein YndB with AHSA1/START domain